jgi:ABC-type lipoprotein release transport system permease subunit
MVDDRVVNSFASRVICVANDSVEFHCAFMPKKEGGYFINIGSAICKKLNVKTGDEISVKFKEDTTEYQFEMPEEFIEVLSQDSDADAIFQSLTDGNKRGLIYLVTAVKSRDKRIERAIKIARNLQAGITSPRLILK